jgi:hypothetical protein
MSCNSSCPSGGSFFGMNNTWNKNSSLRMNDWDPYPEFTNDLQNYSSCKGNGCYGYNQEGYISGDRSRFNPTNYDNLDQTWNKQPRYSMETYVDRNRFNPTDYDSLDKTWNVQKRYDL